jgi:plasmid maintenance system antidote protein VapI
MNPLKVLIIAKSVFGSQLKMAEALGVSKSKISEVVSGKQKLTQDQIHTLVKIYNLDYEWIMDDDSDLNIRYKNQNAEFKYKELENKYSVVMEELSVYQKREIERLKNSGEGSV